MKRRIKELKEKIEGMANSEEGRCESENTEIERRRKGDWEESYKEENGDEGKRGYVIVRY